MSLRAHSGSVDNPHHKQAFLRIHGRRTAFGNPFPDTLVEGRVCGTFPDTFPTTVALVAGADTSVTNGFCYKYRYLISDNVGNQATYSSTNIVKVDTTPKVTAISSLQSGGAAGNGRLEVGDKLILTFSKALTVASVPTTISAGSEGRVGSAIVTLNIPGITQGAVDTGSSAYLASSGVSKNANFGGTVVLVNNGASTTVTVTVTSVSGDPTAIGSGTLVFRAASTITSSTGTAASGTFSTAVGFRLF